MRYSQKSFVAIDFETATGYRDSACSVGIVTVTDGVISNEYHTLIQPPRNEYWSQNINVHGITPHATISSPTFEEVYTEFKKRLAGRTVVAHNEVFDRGVLRQTMAFYGIAYHDIELPDRWECTLKIYRAKGFSPANLHACCNKMGVTLNHHEALSDARACAMLYLLK